MPDSGSSARLARFDLAWQLADACDQACLSASRQDYGAVVNFAGGYSDVSLAKAMASSRAAENASVQRLVFMNRDSVDGQAPEPGTDEPSPLQTRHRFAYNNAKVRTERAIAEMRRNDCVETSVLRPGIVYGTRSFCGSDIANQLLSKSAYMINNSQGICNLINMNNLIETIGLALIVPEADQQAFIVGDRERVSWRDFYQHMAAGLALVLSRVERLKPTACENCFRDMLNGLRVSKPIQDLLPLVLSKL